MHAICRSIRRPLIFLSLALLAGCATPDLRPFATETAKLGAAISAEQTEVQLHLSNVSTRAEARNPQDDRVRTLTQFQSDYSANAAAVDAVMSVAVDYSTALVDLAAKGETGAESAQSLAKSLEGLSSTLGMAFPAANIPAWAGKLVQEISADITRIQAQKSLAAAMQQADPAVDKIASAIAKIYSPNGPQLKIATGLEVLEEGILRDEVGANRLAFYRSLNVARVKQGGVEQTRIEHFFGEVADRVGQRNQGVNICGMTRTSAPLGAAGAAKDEPPCLHGTLVQDLASMSTLLAGLEPQFHAYNKDLAASRMWLQQRNAVVPPIAAGALAWAAEHHRLAGTLEACGGLRALRRDCGNLTFANLKLAVGRVKAIADKGEDHAD
jgi:hypothetical protein